MSQLTANRNDPGKGRNMPVHYSGKKKVGVVSILYASILNRPNERYIDSMPLLLHLEHKSPMLLARHML